MILSAVINLTPTMDLPIPASLGHKAQGWLLNEVHSFLPSLAERLHEQGGYTVSGIHRQFKGRAGKYYLRVTSLASDLTDVLLEALLPNTHIISFSPRKESKQQASPEQRTFPDFEVNGYSVNTSDHPLAGLSSFAGIIQSATRDDSLRVTFTSPTAFGSNGADHPLPAPPLILRSWAEKWNAYAPTSERLGYPIQQFAQDCIQLTDLSGVHTENWYLPNHARGIGFKGGVSMRMRPSDSCENWQAIWDRAQRDWQVLAGFALFCGTGRHTSVGMGQTAPSSKLD